MKKNYIPVKTFILLDVETDKPQEHNGGFAIQENSEIIADGLSIRQAYLYASSPELLATLERCAEYFADRFDGYPENKESIAVKHLRESIKTVIAKAKGDL